MFLSWSETVLQHPIYHVRTRATTIGYIMEVSLPKRIEYFQLLAKEIFNLSK